MSTPDTSPGDELRATKYCTLCNGSDGACPEYDRQPHYVTGIKPGDELEAILLEVQKNTDAWWNTPQPEYKGKHPAIIRAEAKDRLNRLMLTRVKAGLEQPNQLLRSAYQIAKRQGHEVNWEAFTEQLRLELEREHQILHGGSKNEADS